MGLFDFIIGGFEVALGLIGIAVFIAIIVFGSVAFIGAVLASVAIGWIPILMCANSDDYFMLGEGFFGSWALYSLWGYTFLSFGWLVLLYTKPDPDGLPPGWKFLGMFYSMREAYRISADDFSLERFRDGSKNIPATTYGKRMMGRVYSEAEARLHARSAKIESETADYLNTVRGRAEAANRITRAQARKEAADEWKEQNDD